MLKYRLINAVYDLEDLTQYTGVSKSAADIKAKESRAVTPPAGGKPQAPNEYTGAKNVAGSTVNAAAEGKSSAGGVRSAGRVSGAVGATYAVQRDVTAAKVFCKSCGAELSPGRQP